MLIRHHRPSNDPLAGLGSRQQRSWRRTERAIVSAHQAELATSLRNLINLPVRDITTGPAGSVSLTLPGWTVGLAEVGTEPRHRLISLAGRPCHLARTGRYGAFWWIEVASDAEPVVSRTVLLGSRIHLHGAGGSDHHSPGLTPRGTRKEDSFP
jgi:hypothetical protein